MKLPWSRSKDIDASRSDRDLVTFVTRDDKELVAFELRRGANPNACGESGPPVLHRAVFGGSMDVINQLLAAGADVNNNDARYGAPLHWAAQNHNVPVIERLVAAGAELNVRNASGETPLMRAIKATASLEGARCLLALGANPELRDNDGLTVLHLAVCQKRPEVVRELVVAGVFLENYDSDGKTALHLCAANDQVESAVILLEAGALRSTVDFDGRTIDDAARFYKAEGMLSVLRAFDARQAMRQSLGAARELAP
jgi:ankyrin repeat protein